MILCGKKYLPAKATRTTRTTTSTHLLVEDIPRRDRFYGTQMPLLQCKEVRVCGRRQVTSLSL
jgi:hypothetical protein